jgi:hypothetical protein
MISCSRTKEYKVANCSDVWNGTFENRHDGEIDTRIWRKGDVQTERFEDGSISRFKVQWLDSCRYRLTYLSGNEVSSAKKFSPVIVQITEVKRNSYSIEGWVEGNNMSTYSSEIVIKGR